MASFIDVTASDEGALLVVSTWASALVLKLYKLIEMNNITEKNIIL
jgi:hypothetical protein